MSRCNLSKTPPLRIHYPNIYDPTFLGGDYNQKISTLSIIQERIYFTDITNQQLLSINIQADGLDKSQPLDIRYESSSEQFSGTGMVSSDIIKSNYLRKNGLKVNSGHVHPCAVKYGECGELCLPSRSTSGGYRCFDTPTDVAKDLHEFDLKNKDVTSIVNGQDGGLSSDKPNFETTIKTVFAISMFLMIACCLLYGCYYIKTKTSYNDSMNVNSKEPYEEPEVHAIQMKFTEPSNNHNGRIGNVGANDTSETSKDADEKQPMLALEAPPVNNRSNEGMLALTHPSTFTTENRARAADRDRDRDRLDRDREPSGHNPRSKSMHERSSSNPASRAAAGVGLGNYHSTYTDAMHPSRRYILQNSVQTLETNGDLASSSSNIDKNSTLGRNNHNQHSNHYGTYQDKSSRTPKLSLQNQHLIRNQRGHGQLNNPLYEQYNDYSRDHPNGNHPGSQGHRSAHQSTHTIPNYQNSNDMSTVSTHDRDRDADYHTQMNTQNNARNTFQHQTPHSNRDSVDIIRDHARGQIPQSATYSHRDKPSRLRERNTLERERDRDRDREFRDPRDALDDPLLQPSSSNPAVSPTPLSQQNKDRDPDRNRLFHQTQPHSLSSSNNNVNVHEKFTDRDRGNGSTSRDTGSIVNINKSTDTLRRDQPLHRRQNSDAVRSVNEPLSYNADQEAEVYHI